MAGRRTMADAPLLRLSGLSVRRGMRTVLTRVDLEVASGEVVLLVGENGSGKSTLIEAAAGILPPSAGSVVHSGQVIRDSEGRRSQPAPFGLTLQQGGFCEDEVVYDRLATALHVAQRKIDPRWISDRLAEWGLRHREQDRIAWLSGGMTRRLAVLCGLTPGLANAEPRLLLLDEPSEGLDEQSISTLREQIVGLAAAGHGLLIATHDQQLDDLATRRVVVGENRCVEEAIEAPEPAESMGVMVAASEESLVSVFSTWRTLLGGGWHAPDVRRLGPGAVALVVLPGLMSTNSVAADEVPGTLMAGLILLPGLIAALVRPSSLQRLSDPGASDWWSAMLGRRPELRPELSGLGTIAVLTFVSLYLLSGDGSIHISVFLAIIGLTLIACAAAMIHGLDATLPRKGATYAFLLTLLLVWPYLSLIVLLDAGSELVPEALIMAYGIPMAVILLLPMLHDG